VKNEKKFERIPVIGDQLPVERGVEAKFSVSNAYTPGRRLKGIYFQLADWHHENKFLDVSLKHTNTHQLFHLPQIKCMYVPNCMYISSTNYTRYGN